MFIKPLLVLKAPRVQQLALGVLLLCFTACSAALASNKPQAVYSLPSTSPQTTGIPTGRVLYQTNWSQGLVGWNGVTGWLVRDGYLERQTGSESKLVIPYQPVVPNYVIEVRFQIVQTLGVNAFFLITAQPQAGRDGYKVGWREGLLGYIDPTGDDRSASSFASDYVLSDTWHTYRVKVRNNDVQLFDGDIGLGEMHSEQTSFLSTGPLSLNTSQIVIQISQIRLLSL